MHDNRRRRPAPLPASRGKTFFKGKGPAPQSELALCRSTLAGWLSGTAWSWRYFVTLTYRDARPRKLDFIGAQLLDTIRRNADGPGVAFLCREFGGRSGRLHHHALLHGDAWSVSSLDMRWRSRYGHVNIRPYDHRRGAAGYVANYVLKEDTTDSEWCFYTRKRGDDIPLVPIEKRRTGYQLYTEGITEEEKDFTQTQVTYEDTMIDHQQRMFPLTGKAPECIKALRR